MTFYEFILNLFGKLPDNTEILNERYDLLCRTMNQDSELLSEYQLKYFEYLKHLLDNELLDLMTTNPPDNAVQILHEFHHTLNILREQCELPDLINKNIVAIGGKFSCGKSTFLNTLLNKKHLVVEIDPTTSIPTYLMHSEEHEITAVNMFGNRIALDEDEFASLTHEEKEKFGSQIGSLLRSSLIGDPDFAWQHLALLDTPGYTNPDEHTHTKRTDADIAKQALAGASAVLWLISAEDGGIKEDDVRFLQYLEPNTEKLVLLTKADRKSKKDIEEILSLTKNTLAKNNIQVLNVIPVSRNTKKYPMTELYIYLNKWNKPKSMMDFKKKFERIFGSYKHSLSKQANYTEQQISLLNQLVLTSSDDNIAEATIKDIKSHREQLKFYEQKFIQLEYIKENFFEYLDEILNPEG